MVRACPCTCVQQTAIVPHTHHQWCHHQWGIRSHASVGCIRSHAQLGDAQARFCSFAPLACVYRTLYPACALLMLVLLVSLCLLECLFLLLCACMSCVCLLSTCACGASHEAQHCARPRVQPNH